MRFSKKIFCLNILIFIFFVVPAYSHASTFYFDGRASGDWNNLSNWWTDSGLTVQALSLPTSSDDVIISATVSSNTGIAASVNSLVFNDGGSSYYLGINTTVASGATFNGSSYNRSVLTGSAKFNTTYFNGTAPSGGILTLANSKQWRGRVTGTVTGSDDAPITSYVFTNTSSAGGTSAIVGNVSFYNTSACTIGGALTITGDVTFNDSVACGSGTINITGNAVFNNTSRNSGATINITSGTATFNDTSHNDYNISGTTIFNEDSYNYSTVIGNATFNDNSYSRYQITGNATFNDNSYNIGSITGNVDVYYPSENPVGGTFTGTATYYDYPPVISEVTPITSGTDTTPSYTFTTDEAGTITYGGSCSSDTISAAVGSNTIIFNELSVGTYSDCTIIVTDSTLLASNTLTVTSFIISEPVSNSKSGSRGGGGGLSTKPTVQDIIVNPGCSTGDKFDTNTGSACPIVLIEIPGCSSGSGFSITTGQSCTSNPSPQKKLTQDTLTDDTLQTFKFLKDIPFRTTRSDDVRQLQIFLNSHNFPVASIGPGSPGYETRYFGPATRVALAKFQLVVGIKPSNGYFGPITRAYINSLKK